MKKKTIIVGATPNTSRYAYLAAERLISHQHPLVPIGIKRGNVMGTEILDIRDQSHINDVDTISLYLSAKNQEEWEAYLLSLNPKRIIFNPGAENARLVEKANAKGIETLEACTLVMLSAGTY